MPNAPHRGVFISRRLELSVLCLALEEAQRCHGQIVLVGGEAGIGKTRLAQEFATVAAAGSVSVPLGPLRTGRDVASVLAVGTNRRLVCRALQRLDAPSRPRCHRGPP